LLFISSVSSLKSVACQYELSEGRKKQDKSWSTVFFPIYIDDYLFKVEKEDIPRKYRDEFWENIEELREVNALDFSKFVGDDFQQDAYEEAINKLVNGLRKSIQ
jgi:hypothetical protein